MFQKSSRKEATERCWNVFYRKVQGRNENWLINELENSEEKKKLEKKDVREEESWVRFSWKNGK